ELLARFENFAKDYPGARWVADESDDNSTLAAANNQATVRSYIRVLKRMIAEDAERVRRPPKPESQMTREERIADLIYRLRDQQGKAANDYPALDSGPAGELV